MGFCCNGTWCSTPSARCRALPRACFGGFARANRAGGGRTRRRPHSPRAWRPSSTCSAPRRSPWARPRRSCRPRQCRPRRGRLRCTAPRWRRVRDRRAKQRRTGRSADALRRKEAMPLPGMLQRGSLPLRRALRAQEAGPLHSECERERAASRAHACPLRVSTRRLP